MQYKTEQNQILEIYNKKVIKSSTLIYTYIFLIRDHSNTEIRQQTQYLLTKDVYMYLRLFNNLNEINMCFFTKPTKYCIFVLFFFFFFGW